MSVCQPDNIIQVNAGPHERHNAIVTLHCEDPDCKGFPILRELGKQGAATLAGQCHDGELTFIIPQMNAGEVKRYEIGPATEAAPAVAVQENEGQLDFLIGGQLFTSYVVKEGIARPYCYPVCGPGGVEMTNFAPEDHIHHKSLYIAHGEVNGHDNWSEIEGHGHTVNQGYDILSQGPVYAEVQAHNDWESADGEKLLREQTNIRVYNLPDTERFMDITTAWIAAYQGIFFGDTKEAGNIAVRVAESMEGDRGGTIVNAYGAVGEDECWGQRAPWVDYYGPVEGQTVGIAIFDHPNNFRHPTWWHVRDYGLFNANCWGLHDYYGDWSLRGDHAMPAGDMLQFNFRLYLHAGDVNQADVAGRYLDFAYPPTVQEE